MRKLLWGFVAVGMFACGSGEKPTDNSIDDFLTEGEEETTEGDDPGIPQEVINEFMNALPSPLETSVALKESGIPYSSDFLNDPQKVSHYNSAFSRAMNLGVYGTDLGYTNIYEQNQDAIFYLNAIRDLADELSIGQFFEFTTIKRLATQSTNLDSLLLVTTQNFNKINEHLQSKKRSNLSVMLLAGGWIEAMQISCKVSQANPENKTLRDKVAEQKVVCENINFLLSIYVDSNPYVKDLHEDMQRLFAAFEQIEVITKYGEQEVQIIDGVPTIVDSTTQETNATQEDIDKISSIVYEIRNRIVD